MKATTPLFKPFIGGPIHLLYASRDIEDVFWVRGTLADAWVTGRKRADRRLKIATHSLTQLVGSGLWLDLEPRSFTIPLDEYEAEMSNDRHLLLECDTGTFIFQPMDARSLTTFYLHVVNDEDEGYDELIRLTTSEDAEQIDDEELYELLYS